MYLARVLVSALIFSNLQACQHGWLARFEQQKVAAGCLQDLPYIVHNAVNSSPVVSILGDVLSSEGTHSAS